MRDWKWNRCHRYDTNSSPCTDMPPLISFWEGAFASWKRSTALTERMEAKQEFHNCNIRWGATTCISRAPHARCHPQRKTTWFQKIRAVYMYYIHINTRRQIPETEVCTLKWYGNVLSSSLIFGWQQREGGEAKISGGGKGRGKFALRINEVAFWTFWVNIWRISHNLMNNGYCTLPLRVSNSYFLLNWKNKIKTKTWTYGCKAGT